MQVVFARQLDNDGNLLLFPAISLDGELLNEAKVAEYRCTFRNLRCCLRALLFRATFPLVNRLVEFLSRC